MPRQQTLDDAALQAKGIQILNEQLGASDALRFMSLMHHAPTDYVEVSRKIFEGRSAEEIFDECAQMDNNSHSR